MNPVLSTVWVHLLTFFWYKKLLRMPIKPIKYALWAIATISVLALGYSSYLLWRVARVAVGYKTKTLCSGVFISKRTPESILSNDLAEGLSAPLQSIIDQIDTEVQEQATTGSLFGLVTRKAIFRPGLGCTLLVGSSEAQLRSRRDLLRSPQINAIPLSPSVKPKELTKTEQLPPEIDSIKLQELVEDSFAEKNSNNLPRTRALIILYDGSIIVERYAPGFNADTPLIGWSMTKSVINALVGILVKEGKLSLQDRNLVPQWEGDRRKNITLKQLLQMNSGLQFTEQCEDPLADCPQMLFNAKNMAAYGANKPLIKEPGSDWDYSSGTTNIISGIIRDAVDGTDLDYLTFPRRALFDRLGMSTAIIETDTAGNFVGSSLMYASARDWARFGLLYLQDGVWENERILPEDWVEFSRTSAPVAKGSYGVHFWLMKNYPQQKPLPEDLFMADGYQGQSVIIIPSRKLVVVRLGKDGWQKRKFIEQLLAAIPDNK
jgi:CubicO group peptidase (beta-lactamase class C family)